MHWIRGKYYVQIRSDGTGKDIWKQKAGEACGAVSDSGIWTWCVRAARRKWRGKDNTDAHDRRYSQAHAGADYLRRRTDRTARRDIPEPAGVSAAGFRAL